MWHKIHYQSGVVMVTVILIIVIVAVSAVYMIDSSYKVLHKARQQSEHEQLQQYARAVEDFGISVLYWDNWFDALIWHPEQIDYDLPRPSLEADNPLGYDPHNDSKFESWSRPHTPDFIKSDLSKDFHTQDVLYITDMNRFFNINNLHFSNSVDAEEAFAYNVKIFESLLRQITEKSFDTDKFINEVLDWLDHDNDSRSAILLTEDDVYRRAGSTYRPPNRPITSIGELRHVLGMTPGLLEKLSRFVVTLPVYRENFSPYKQAFSPHNQITQDVLGQNSPELTKINVNTCPPELLTALFSLFNNQQALKVALEKQGYFQNINKQQALNFRTFYSRKVRLNLAAESDSMQSKNLISAMENGIDLVASEYSQFFLIESFFQKKNGQFFNHESLVYKNKTRFNVKPVVIQRHFDWLPLHQLDNQVNNKAG